MRGLTPNERALMTAPPEQIHTESEWDTDVPRLVAAGRVVVRITGRWETDEHEGWLETVVTTDMGALALRVCPVNE